MKTSKHELAHMTWKEIEAAYQENPVIFVPMGSMEEHGPHVPVGDFLSAYQIAKRAAEESGNYCLPPLPFGYSEFFRGFPGTISLAPSTVHDVIRDICISLIEHGVERIILVSGHYGNAPILDMLARELMRTYQIWIGKIDLWHCISPEFKKELFGSENVMGHGGEPDTSVMRYLFPEDMRMDLLDGALGQDDSVRKWEAFDIAHINVSPLEDVDVSMYFNFEQLSARGIMGNPNMSDPAIGRKIVERLVHYCVAFAEKMKMSNTTV